MPKPIQSRTSPSQILWKRYLKELDPYNPTNQQLERFGSVKSPKKSFLGSTNRDVPLDTLETSLLERIAFDSMNEVPKIRYAAEALWAIRIVQEDYSELSVEEVSELFEESGSEIIINHEDLI